MSSVHVFTYTRAYRSHSFPTGSQHTVRRSYGLFPPFPRWRYSTPKTARGEFCRGCVLYHIDKYAVLHTFEAPTKSVISPINTNERTKRQFREKNSQQIDRKFSTDNSVCRRISVTSHARLRSKRSSSWSMRILPVWIKYRGL